MEPAAEAADRRAAGKEAAVMRSGRAEARALGSWSRISGSTLCSRPLSRRNTDSSSPRRSNRHLLDVSKR